VNPVPTHVRLVGLLAAAVSVLVMVSVMATAAVMANGVTALGTRVHSFAVGAQPTVEVTTSVGNIQIESGAAGRVEVEERWSASSLTRAVAQQELNAIQGDVRQDGDVVRVRLSELKVRPWAFSRSSSLRVRVPPGTTLRITADSAEIRLVRLSGTAQVIARSGAVIVDSSTLAGDSQLTNRLGLVQLNDVTVAGHTTLGSEFGRVAFNGSMAPGGSALDVHNNAGEVEVLLPRPTDARARVAINSGSFRADPAWAFDVVSAGGSKTATADLGSNPTGSIFISVGAGQVSFGVLPAAAAQLRPALSGPRAPPGGPPRPHRPPASLPAVGPRPRA
jgi:hypothetical protein